MSITTKHNTLADHAPAVSGYDTAVAYRRLRQQLPDDALTMPLQLSLSPLPVIPAQSKQHGNHIATTLAALTGATGCLPPAYEETALAQANSRNHAYADFITLFQRHLADLLVEASAKYSAHKQSRWRERENNPFLKAIAAMAGFDNNTKPDFSIRFATLFAENRRNAASLKAILEDIFCVPVAIAEFQSRSQTIPENERSFLNGQYRLGIDCCIGASVQHAASHFHIILGALTYAQFRNFLPDQPAIRHLTTLAQLYCGTGLTFHIQLILDKDETPTASLSGEYRLGYDLWLASNQLPQHRNDAVFDGQAIAASIPQDIHYAS